MNVHTYLFFAGNCEEAIRFYHAAIGAETTYFMRFAEGPPPLRRSGQEDKVFHATLRVGETLLNMSDDLDASCCEFKGFALLLHADRQAAAEAAFAALKAGGTVNLPMQETFWASRYGMVTDRFGVTWKVQSDKRSTD